MAKRDRATPRRIRFNKGAVEGIARPERGRVYVFDSQTPALAVCVTEKGTRTFYLYRRIHGKPQRVRIGRYPQVTVAAAREQATRLNYEVATGKDPQAESQQRRGGETLEQAFERCVAAPTRRKGTKAARTVQGYQEQWDKHLAPWADRKLSAITTRQVDTLHAEIGEGGERTRPYMANRVLSLLSATFEFAIRDGAQIVNPCRAVERYPEESRDRALQLSEMPDFLDAVRAEPDEQMRDFFLLLLFTGARKGNVEAAQWDEFDLKRRVWTPIVKGGKAHTIPLVNEAEAILKRRQRTADGSPWVFPARGRTGHVVEPRPQWRRILATAGLVDVRIHDLRRTLASWMADAGSTETIIGAVLGHSPTSVTGVYARVTEDARREAMQTAVRAMLKTENGRG